MNYNKLGLLGGVAVLVAAVVALPVAFVALSVFGGGGDTWAHLVSTALSRYVGNTLILLALVT